MVRTNVLGILLVTTLYNKHYKLIKWNICEFKMLKCIWYFIVTEHNEVM